MQFNNFANKLTHNIGNGFKISGRISKVVGLTLEADGPNCSIGDMVEIISEKNNCTYKAQVVGFRNNKVLLFPFDSVEGISCGDQIFVADEGFSINVGEHLLGRVLDGLGNPIDGKGELNSPNSHKWSIKRAAPNAMLRPRINEQFHTKVKAIDSLTSCGVGQRMGIFAGSGVGKSSLLGMVCRNSNADLNVISLIGERGKEVVEFIEDSLGEEGLKKSVIIVSTSDKSPLQRLKGAEMAIAISEYFRDQGKHVMLVMDSVTRLAMAQREIGLAAGEPPATRGYPPSVFNMLPALLERTGKNSNGAISAFFTVLTEGDDINDPISDTVRGILDGHLVLSRDLATKGHYPAIDVLESVSRVMGNVTSESHRKLAQLMRKYLAIYRDAEDMINVGAYKSGSNAQIDKAITLKPHFDKILQQGLIESVKIETVLETLAGLLADEEV
ncbi:FliI/YscN family ATPase [Lentisphaerae bacterium WC36]|nr:FliI/YscN family ATPase [Lentisphaerae bacterium WC36]